MRNFLNADFWDHMIGCYLTASDYVRSFFRYKNTYKNYFQVMRKFRNKEYPINATLLNGEQVVLENPFQTISLSVQGRTSFSQEGNLLVIDNPYLEKKVRLIDWEDNGDIFGVYLYDGYMDLNVKGKMIVDIGANIGDTAIYFALMGAKKVIALEPFPKNYESAKKNIELNDLADRIQLLLAGCSKERGYALVDQRIGGIDCVIGSASEGDKKEITLMTLEEIVGSYDGGLVLKMDCESCEYDVVLNTPRKILQKFDQMYIEYHFGYKNLKSKLEGCGFEVTVNRCKLVGGGLTGHIIAKPKSHL